MCACEGQRLALGVFLSHSLYIAKGRVTCVNAELTALAVLAGLSGDLSPPSHSGITGGVSIHNSGACYSKPFTCGATSPDPQVLLK